MAFAGTPAQISPGGNVFIYYGTRSDHCTAADVDPFQNNGICTNPAV